MKNLENEYKNRFNAQEMPVGKTDSDELWAAVSTELDAAAPTRRPLLGFAWYRLVLCFFLLLFIGAWGLYCAYRIPSALPHAGTSNGLMGKDRSTATNPPKNAKLDAAVPLASERSAHTPEQSRGANKTTTATGYFSKITPSGKENRGKNQPKSAQKVVQSAESEISNKAENTVYTAPDGSMAVSAMPDNVVAVPANAKNASMQVFGPMAILPFLPLNPILNLAKQPILPFHTAPNNPKKRPSLEWQIAAESGANTVVFRFAGADQKDLIDKKNSAELPRLGNSVALRASLLWKQRWAFATGLELHQYRSVFSYEQKQTIQVLKTNQLLRALVNTVNGDTLRKIFGDTLINAQSTRTVWHNNTFRQIAIPLEVGIQKDMGKWLVGGGIGAVIALTTGQSGKALDGNAQIVAFETEDAIAPFANIGIGLRVSPVIGYRMGHHWALSLRPQWTWQRNTGAGLHLNAHIFNANLGLQYTIR